MKKKGKLVNKSKRGLFFNNSGCADPTAYYAIKDIELESKVSDLVHVIRTVASLAGFEVVGRIHFRHKKTGKEFK